MKICFDEVGSATSSTFSSDVSFEYHEYSVWNSMLDALCHFEVGVGLEAPFASCQRSRLCEKLAVSALPTCCN